jgi:drug/metabolite transporter (DMT)-like permease
MTEPTLEAVRADAAASPGPTAAHSSLDEGAPGKPAEPGPARMGPLGSRPFGILCLLVTAVGWGVNWPIMKVILHDWPPFFARGTAGLAAAFGLALIAAARRERLSIPPRAWRPLASAAFSNVFVWMGFATLSMVWLTVGEAALLVFTMPIWTTVFAWPLLGARPTLRSIAALALGVAGIGMVLVGPGFALGGGKLPGVVFALGAAVLFAFSTIASRSPIPMPPIALTAWQVGLGCLPMVLIGLVFERPNLGALHGLGWMGMAYMAIVPMALCYLSWFAALRQLPPSTASTSMLLVPVIGILAASAVLGEPLGARESLVLACTLGGVGLALKRS